jgi:hypothetical protein
LSSAGWRVGFESGIYSNFIQIILKLKYVFFSGLKPLNPNPQCRTFCNLILALPVRLVLSSFRYGLWRPTHSAPSVLAEGRHQEINEFIKL